jgi:hypothetical protein
MNDRYCHAFSTNGKRVYRLTAAQFADTQVLVAGSYNHWISAFTLDGELLWEVKIGGFPFCIAAADIDGDGSDEILVASGDQQLYAISSLGKLLWTYQTGGMLYTVAIGSLDGASLRIMTGGTDQWIYMLSPNGELLARRPAPKSAIAKSEVPSGNGGPGAVRHLAMLHDAASGCDRLACHTFDAMWSMDLSVLEGESLQERFRRTFRPFASLSADSHRSCEPPTWNAFSMTKGDINGDGIDEMLLGSSTIRGAAPDDILVVDINGDIIRKVRLEDENLNRNDMIYRCLTPAIGTYRGMETAIIAQSGPRLLVLDKELNLLAAGLARVSFTDIATVTKNGVTRAALPVLGDDSILTVRLEPGWEDEFNGHDFTGIGKRMRTACTGIAEDLAKRTTRPADKRTFTVEIAAVFMTKAKAQHLQHYIDHYRWVRGQFPYGNLQFATVFWLSEDGCKVSPSGKGWVLDPRMDYEFTQDEILAIAGRLEREGVPFLIQNSHGCGGFLKLETIEKICQRAPTTFVGLVGSETNEYHVLAQFMSEYLAPEMDILKRHGKKLVLREGSQFWPYVMAQKDIYDIIFCGDYADVLIPCAEEAASRNGEIHVACRAGVWMSGLVDEWGARVIADQLGKNPCWTWDTIMSGQLYLRLIVAHAALGASFFMFHNGSDNGSGEPSYAPTGEPFAWTDVGRESLVPFLHMLGTGVLQPPGRDACAYVSTTAVAWRPLSNRFLTDIAKGHVFSRFVPERAHERYVFSKFESWWTLSDAFDTDAGSYLWGKRRHHATLIPHTAGGFVPMLSAHTPPAAQKQFKTVFETDGDRWHHDGHIYDPAEGKRLIEKSMVRSANDLPFRVDGDVFFQAARTERGYRLYIVDPDIVEPSDKPVKIYLRDRAEAVRDVVADMDIGVNDNVIALTVPAGFMRIVDVANVGS